MNLPLSIIANITIPPTRIVHLIQQGTPGINGQTLYADLPCVLLANHGGDPTGGTDSTLAFLAAKAALPHGGIIACAPKGIYAMNLVLDSSWIGITIQGPGLSSGNAAPTSGYFKPYDPTLPTIQFGDNGPLLTAGASLRDVCFYGENTGHIGLAFAGGSYRNFADNIQIFNFTKRCLSYSCAPTVSPCSYNKINGLSIYTAVQGAEGIYCEDNAAIGDNDAFTTANTITNFDLHTNGGYQIHMKGSQLVMGTGYIQQSNQGLGICLEKGTSLRLPSLGLTSVTVDNAAGADATCITVNTGNDWQSNTTFNCSPVYGQYTTTGPVFIVANTTILSSGMSAGSGSATLASMTGVTVGRAIEIAGAGPTVAGLVTPLVTTVASISGSTVSFPAGVTSGNSVSSGAVVWTGDMVEDPTFLQPGTNFLSGNGLNLNPSRLTRLPRGANKGMLLRGGYGTVPPLNAFEPFWDLGHLGLSYLQDDGYSSSIVSITQSGTTVTVTTAAPNNVAVGDVIQIDGPLQPGITGDWVASARISSTVFTFTSTVSQTLASVTGTLIFYNNKVSKWAFGNLCLGGRLLMKDKTGTWNNVLVQNIGNGNFSLNTPDTVNGQMTLYAGSALTTDNVVQTFASGIVNWGVSGYGTSRSARGTTGGAFTTTQRNAFSGLTAADVGMMVYDTTLGYPVYLHSQTGPVWHNGAGAAV